ncbi:MAG: ABC transporter permease [Candidatus Hydrogenedentes bacterium]|nr:ABC transporter permease [Candidatus Hydrogenedentota bacterium]
MLLRRMGLHHYGRVFAAIAGITLRLHLRRRKTWVMAVLAVVPAALPAIIGYYGAGRSGPPDRLFVALTDFVYVYTLVPLLALFYACSLLSEEIEGQTLPLFLSRPVPRSALVLGKFAAYVAIASALAGLSLAALFYASALFLRLPVSSAHHALLVRYTALCVAGLLAYGALCMMVSSLTRRPALIAAVFIFGWEKMVIALPGYADFLTVQKYLAALLPQVGFRRLEIAKVELPVELMREVIPVSAGAALAVLLAVSGLLLAVACVAVSRRQFAASGSGGE